MILIAALEIAVIFALTKLGGSGISQTVGSRLQNPTTEAAGGARLKLLPELWKEIEESPVIGQGFGKQVTYSSFLPDRIAQGNPEGQITSYAFEWGYLDMWLKIGAVGLAIYLLFLGQIFWRVWKIPNLGVLGGLVALVALNITSPYLNHPLGIGYVILSFLSLRDYEQTTG